MKKKYNILFLWGSFEPNNLGSQALLYSNLSVLKSFINNIYLISFFTKKDELIKIKLLNELFKINLIYVNFFKIIWGLIFLKKRIGSLDISKIDLIFDISEGDSFSDIYGFKRFLIIFLSKLLFINNRKKLITAPQTIGPFNNYISLFLAKFVLKRHHLIFSRDINTYKLLNRHNIKSTLVYDSAFTLPFKSKGMLRKYKNKLGLNISSLLYKQSHVFGIRFSYKKFIIDLISKLLTLKYKIYLISHVNSENFDDYDACLEIKKYFNNKNIIVVDRFKNCFEAKSFISSLDIFLGSRMHSCIASISTNVPTIPLAYSYKFEGVFGLIPNSVCFNLYDYNNPNILIADISLELKKLILHKPIFSIPDSFNFKKIITSYLDDI